MAYAVLRQDWASGTTTPVLAGSVSLLDLGFETYGLHRVVAQVDARTRRPPGWPGHYTRH